MSTPKDQAFLDLIRATDLALDAAWMLADVAKDKKASEWQEGGYAYGAFDRLRKAFWVSMRATGQAMGVPPDDRPTVPPPSQPCVIVMEGGLIQDIYTDAPIDVTIIDWDVEGMGEDELRFVQYENHRDAVYVCDRGRHKYDDLLDPIRAMLDEFYGRCEGCDGSGIRDDAHPNCVMHLPADWHIVQRCDTCQKFDCDDAAAKSRYSEVRTIFCADGDDHTVVETKSRIQDAEKKEAG